MDAEFCLCIHKPRRSASMMKVMSMVLSMTEAVVETEENGVSVPGLNSDTGFMNVCGRCEDPCALRLRPEPRRKPEGGESRQGNKEGAKAVGPDWLS